MATQLVNVRSAFVAPAGRIFHDFDYSQIENRVSAAKAGERPLLEGFLAGADYYRMIYKQMSGWPGELADIPKTLRQVGKVMVLGQGYGQGKKGAARQLKLDWNDPDQRDQACRQVDAYWDGLPATRYARDEAIARARREGGARSHFGRWRPLPDIHSADGFLRSRAERQVWNYIIQASSADWMKIAILRAHRALRNRDVTFHLTVHDELIVAPSLREKLREVAWLTRHAAEFRVPDLPRSSPFYKPCDDLYPGGGFFVPTEQTWGFNWGEQHEVEDKTVKGEVEPGIVTVARASGVELDFHSFCGKRLDLGEPHGMEEAEILAHLKPDYETSSRKSRIVVPRQVADAGTDLIDAARGKLAEEADVAEPFRYPCVVVDLPVVSAEGASFVMLAAQSCPGDEWLYLRYEGRRVDANRQVAAKALVGWIRQAPFGDKCQTERYDARGAVVRVEF